MRSSSHTALKPRYPAGCCGFGCKESFQETWIAGPSLIILPRLRYIMIDPNMYSSNPLIEYLLMVGGLLCFFQEVPCRTKRRGCYVGAWGIQENCDDKPKPESEYLSTTWRCTRWAGLDGHAPYVHWWEPHFGKGQKGHPALAKITMGSLNWEVNCWAV